MTAKKANYFLVYNCPLTPGNSCNIVRVENFVITPSENGVPGVFFFSCTLAAIIKLRASGAGLFCLVLR